MTLEKRFSSKEFVHNAVPSPQRVSCECSFSLLRLFLEKNVTLVHSYDVNLVVKQPWDICRISWC